MWIKRADLKEQIGGQGSCQDRATLAGAARRRKGWQGGRAEVSAIYIYMGLVKNMLYPENILEGYIF